MTSFLAKEVNFYVIMQAKLSFRPVEIQHRDIFQPYLTKNSQTCDRAFVNTFCWQHLFHTQWAEANDFLVIRAFINGERRAAYIVVSQKETPIYTDILPLLEANAAELDQPLTLMGLSEEECEILQQQLPGQFFFDKNRDFADYVYKADDLKTLKGRKYAPKRNHVNKFKSLYNYHYEAITKENIADCLQLEESWISQHSEDESAQSEYITIQKAFQHFEALGLLGGALYVDGKLVAFTYGSAIRNDIFCTHVEKADIHYEGVYQMINYLFAQHLPEQFTFINREEDMGLAGLRKSKSSYQPAMLAYKHTALKLNDEMQDIIHVWKKCFGEDDPSIYTFLSRYYFNHCTMLEKVDGHVVSTVFMIPCQTQFGLAAYLYGIATLPEYQHQGISGRLILQMLEKCKENGAVFSFLIPADDKLKDYYTKFGYMNTLTNAVFESDMDLGTGDTKKDRIMVLPFDESFQVEKLSAFLEFHPML